ncbi:hypothetical protein A2U01_0095973, partial [Trifolium medium]|nr:hypothetical protein [Trifolium medium]
NQTPTEQRKPEGGRVAERKRTSRGGRRWEAADRRRPVVVCGGGS